MTKNTKFAREAVISFGILIRYQRDSLQKRLATNPTWLDSSIGQTGKLGDFRRDLGGATAAKSKGRGEKSDPGADQGRQGAQKRMLQCTCQMNIDIQISQIFIQLLCRPWYSVGV